MEKGAGEKGDKKKAKEIGKENRSGKKRKERT